MNLHFERVTEGYYCPRCLGTDGAVMPSGMFVACVWCAWQYMLPIPFHDCMPESPPCEHNRQQSWQCIGYTLYQCLDCRIEWEVSLREELEEIRCKHQ